MLRTFFISIFFFTLTDNTFCQANIGAVSFSDAQNNLILCENESGFFNILSPVTPPANMGIAGVAYDPGVGIAVFSSVPSFSNGDILNDPNLLGFIGQQTQSSFFTPLEISYTNLFNLQTPPMPSNLTSPTTFYLQVITFYSIQDNVPYVSGSNGLPDIDYSATYSVTLQPAISISTQEDCINHELNVQVTQLGMGPISFQISSSFPASLSFPATITNNSSFTISGIADNSVLGFTVSNIDGCAANANVSFQGLVYGQINNTETSVCENGQPLTLFGLPANGVWSCSIPSMISGNQFIPNGQNISTSTNYTIEYTPTNGLNGCNIPGTFNIAVTPEVIAQITGPISMCNNAVLQNYSTDNPGGVWTTDFNAIDQNGVLNPQVLTPGLHTINYTPVANCATTSQLDIVIDFLPNLHMTLDTNKGCAPLFVHLLDLTPGVVSDRHWIIDGVSYAANSDDFPFVFENPTCYDIALTSLNDFGCRDTLYHVDWICPYDNPYMSFTFNPQHPDIANPEVTFYSGNTAVSEIVWDFGDGTGSVEYNPLHYFFNTVPAEFEVCATGTDLHNCSATSCQYITIASGFKLYMPNAYTPDQDGLNDGFRPVMDSKREIAKYLFQVYNRDGENIFETEDIHTAWYGNSNKGDFFVKDGAYLWKIKIWLHGDVEPKTFDGTVIIVR
jgi:hypothetical protein